MATNNEKLQELSVEEKLQHLYELQRIDTEIDKIKTLRGELPLEVQDLEDEIAGLETRLENLKNEIAVETLLAPGHWYSVRCFGRLSLLAVRRLCDGYVSYYLFSFCQYGLGSSDRRFVCEFIQMRNEI